MCFGIWVTPLFYLHWQAVEQLLLRVLAVAHGYEPRSTCASSPPVGRGTGCSLVDQMYVWPLGVCACWIYVN